MKNLLLRFLAVAAIFSTILFVGGCEVQNPDTVPVAQTQDLSSFTDKYISPKNTGDLISMSEMMKVTKVTDPQIIAEIDWMYKKNFMTKDQFCDLHKSGVDVNEVSMWGYPSIFSGQEYDVNPYPRMRIQQELQKERNNTGSARHQVFSTIYSGGTINVRVLNSVPAEWKTAISQACAQWNALGESVQFSISTTTASAAIGNALDFKSKDLGDGCKYAQTSDLPYPYGFAEAVAINAGYYCNYNPAVPAATKKAVIMHELGHVIGLGHTDQWDAYGISGLSCADNNHTDSNSLMRKILLIDASPSFTTCDLAVIHKFW